VAAGPGPPATRSAGAVDYSTCSAQRAPMSILSILPMDLLPAPELAISEGSKIASAYHEP
jgi:hypothetical protein